MKRDTKRDEWSDIATTLNRFANPEDARRAIEACGVTLRPAASPWEGITPAEIILESGGGVAFDLKSRYWLPGHERLLWALKNKVPDVRVDFFCEEEGDDDEPRCTYRIFSNGKIYETRTRLALGRWIDNEALVGLFNFWLREIGSDYRAGHHLGTTIVLVQREDVLRALHDADLVTIAGPTSEATWAALEREQLLAQS